MGERGKQSGWLYAPNVSWPWALGASLIWIAALVAASKTDVARDFENKLTRPIEFRIRNEMGGSPILDPKIKVFAIDDSTVSYLGNSDLTILQWAQLLKNLAKVEPEAIIVDKMFGIIGGGGDAALEAQIAQAARDIKAIKTPIIIGSFIAPTKLKYRPSMSLKRSEFSLVKMVSPGPESQGREAQARHLRLPVSRSAYLYGPSPSLQSAFSRIGHILYSGDHSIIPYLRVSGEYAIPHMAFLIKDSRSFTRGQLMVDGIKVPMDSNGVVPINFASYEEYLKHTRPLLKNIQAAAANLDPVNVEQGDIIYLIPMFYTGNTDFKPTPFGQMPGGFAHLAVINSIITGKWLLPVGHEALLIAVFGLLGVTAALSFGPIGFALSTIGGTAVTFGFVIGMFVFADVTFHWTLPITAFLLSAGTVFVEKMRVREKKAMFLRSTLDGMVAPSQLTLMASHPELVNFDARERVLSIMFIDIVGFSLIAENQLPRLAFDNLKQVLSEITEVVNLYGGIVNKNLGDGLLCFFGHDIKTDTWTSDHAEKAAACAIQIQKESLPKTILNHSQGIPIYPLRIGINTSSVFLGNIGSHSRIDFTLIGNGVNFAKRLEGACDTHSVMMSSTTKELIDPGSGVFHGLKKRLITIKHHEESVIAYEIDPYIDQPDIRREALEVYDQSAKMARSRKRWMVDRPGVLTALTNVGVGQIINFSLTGVSIRLPMLMASGSITRLQLASMDGHLQTILSDNDLGNIEGEVRWGYSEGGHFLHGVRFRDIDEVRASFVVQQLRSIIGRRDLEETESLSESPSSPARSA